MSGPQVRHGTTARIYNQHKQNVSIYVEVGIVFK